MSGPASSYDAIVVGAGHNGLVAGFYLARGGMRVAILEARESVGGACKTEELIPGYRFSTCANWLGWWRAKIVEDMGLLDRGLEIGGADVWCRVLRDGSGFTWWQDEAELKAEIARLSKRDAERWGEWRGLWDEVIETLGPWLLSYPPNWDRLVAENPQGALASLGDHSIADVIDGFFETEAMRSGIVAPHDAGSLYEPGSALLMAVSEAMRHYSESGEPPPRGYVKGGMGEVTAAMAGAAAEAGASIFTSTAVERVLVEDGGVAGVALADGGALAADRVLLGCDPATAARLLGDALDPGLRQRLAALKADIAPLKLHCAMRGLPEWSSFPGSDLPYQGPFALCRTREQSEEAWHAASRGELPRDPFMSVMTPSLWDRTVAPDGGHTISVWTLYAPVEPRRGSWETRREEMLELMIQALEKEAPAFRDHLVEAVLLTPADLEARVGLSRGNIHHIDMVADQILASRPLPELANYRFPLPGLYGCGSSHHPSGEVSGAPGHNAAHALLEDAGAVTASWQQRTR